MVWKCIVYHINNPDNGHTRLKHTVEEKYKNNFDQSVQKQWRGGKREEKLTTDNFDPFCITHKLKKKKWNEEKTIRTMKSNTDVWFHNKTKKMAFYSHAAWHCLSWLVDR